MLDINLNLTKQQRDARLGKLREEFSRYFGFYPSGSISEALAYSQVAGQLQTTPPAELTNQETANRTTANINRSYGDSEEIRKAVPIFNIFVNGDSSAYRALPITEQPTSIPASLGRTDVTTTQSPSILQKLLDIAGNQPDFLSKYVRMFFSRTFAGRSGVPNLSENLDPQNPTLNSAFYPNLDSIGFNDSNEETIAKNKLSAFLMNHPLLSTGEKNADLLSVFFNAFPTLEFTRATPILNIKIFSSRQVIQDGRLGALSLSKTLEGAINISTTDPSRNNSLNALALANQVTASAFGNTDQNFQNYSIIGAELFRSPQTLVNPDQAKIQNNFLAPPIDPFRPLATIKNFTVDIKSVGAGLISTKQGRLQIVLHDRSRMGEFADLIKPDRFGQSFIEVEYGWSHPDQFNPSLEFGSVNPYADLLNLTRIKEQYNVVNASYSFDDVGQVTIDLSLLTRGISDMAELSITGKQDPVKSQLTTINNLARSLNDILSNLFRRQINNDTSNRRSEIRGEQIINSMSDSASLIYLTPELNRSLTDLKSNLENIINRGTETSKASARTALSLLTRFENETKNLRSLTVSNEIKETIRQIIQNSPNNNNNDANFFDKDIFFQSVGQDTRQKFQTQGRNGRIQSTLVARTTQTSRASDAQQQASINNANQQLDQSIAAITGLLGGREYISFGTLVMAMVAKPLAALPDKYAEVQVYFYHFNNKASIMSHFNISQFPVDLKFFIREYARMRFENIARSVNLTITDFVGFLGNRIINDVLNPAYGIQGLYKLDENNAAVINAEPLVGRNSNATDAQITEAFNNQMRVLMERHNISGAPDFQMPQLTMETEAIPCSTDTNQTILKIHFYDRTNSSRSPLRELLTLSNDNNVAAAASFASDAASGEASIRLAINNQESQTADRNRTANATPTSAQRGQIANDLRNHWRQLYTQVRNHAVEEGILRESNGTLVYAGGPKKLKEMVMRYTPHIIYGCMNTSIKQASLQTQQNATLSTINMLRNVNSDPLLANGEQVGSVPLQVYPCELSITSLGCPLVKFSQEIFVDFNTNTTVDNIYFITGITHKIESGMFETTLKLTPNDAFGQYRNFVSQLNQASKYFNEQGQTEFDNFVNQLRADESPASNPRSSRGHRRGRRH